MSGEGTHLQEGVFCKPSSHVERESEKRSVSGDVGGENAQVEQNRAVATGLGRRSGRRSWLRKTELCALENNTNNYLKMKCLSAEGVSFFRQP